MHDTRLFLMHLSHHDREVHGTHGKGGSLLRHAEYRVVVGVIDVNAARRKKVCTSVTRLIRMWETFLSNVSLRSAILLIDFVVLFRPFDRMLTGYNNKIGQASYPSYPSRLKKAATAWLKAVITYYFRHTHTHTHNFYAKFKTSEF
jgi:hypothetical protein